MNTLGVEQPHRLKHSFAYDRPVVLGERRKYDMQSNITAVFLVGCVCVWVHKVRRRIEKPLKHHLGLKLC